jgi:hypothetical protein
MQLGYLASATEWDLTGTWESKYQFGTLEEVMTANIQQVGENILGSFTVKPSTGNDYSGIIFGTVMGEDKGLPDGEGSAERITNGHNLHRRSYRR